MDAFAQATGQAIYTYDKLPTPNTLFATYVVSTQANVLFSCDIPETASQMPPKLKELYVRIITAQDIINAGYNNELMNAGHFENMPVDTILAETKNVVDYAGKPLLLVLAKNETAAFDIAHWIQNNRIKYTPCEKPPLLDVEESMKDPSNRKIFSYNVLTRSPRGNVVQQTPVENYSRSPDVQGYKVDDLKPGGKGWEKFSDMSQYLVLSGTQKSGSQMHFYMETQCAYAVPDEVEELVVHASTQSPDETHKAVAYALNIPNNSVEVKVKRLGGGFGGKTVQSKIPALAAAVASKLIGKPIFFKLTRDTDSSIFGQRGDLFSTYQIAINRNSLAVEAWWVSHNLDAGSTQDCSGIVSSKTVTVSGNCYNIKPMFLAEASYWRTNKASSTAFRSFGVAQAHLVIELCLERAAIKLKCSPEELRRVNFFKDGDSTPFELPPLQKVYLQGVWDALKTSVKYEALVEEVKKFNSDNKLRKKGVAIVPMKYDVSYEIPELNQGMCVINIWNQDGSVRVLHGGIDMGQGLNTKVLQVASSILKIPVEFIKVGPMSTAVLSNTSSTGSSTGTDLNCGAVEDGCRKIMARLDKLVDLHRNSPDKSDIVSAWDNRDLRGLFREGIWAKLVNLAFNSSTDLIEHGYYSTPLIGPPKDNQKAVGKTCWYINWAACCAEVEIDVLTGEMLIHKTHIVYDAGHSLNPAIDIGQIEGGLVQGIGSLIMEEPLYDKHTGKLITSNLWEYKLPCTRTIPLDITTILYSIPSDLSPKPMSDSLDDLSDNNRKFTTKEDRRAALVRHLMSSTDPKGAIRSNNTNTNAPSQNVSTSGGLHNVYDVAAETPPDDNLPKDVPDYSIQSSKTTGEPPYVLANAVFLALWHAIRAARKDAAEPEDFEFSSPATVKKILEVLPSPTSHFKPIPLHHT